MKEYDEINDILIELTDAIGWTGQGKQMEAFLRARKALKNLVDRIDSAERVQPTLKEGLNMPAVVRNNFIIGLAVQLCLVYDMKHCCPWNNLWPDEKDKYIRDANKITDELIKCGYIEEFRN